MQSTSATYKSIIAGEHRFETQIFLNQRETAYPYSKILSLIRTRKAFPSNSPTIGSALASMLDLSIIKPNFSLPKRCQIDVKIRAVNSSQQSEWLAAGTYFIDQRRERITKSGERVLDISAYDAMIKSEQDYPNTEHSWPYRDRYVIAEIAETIGVTVDSRTNAFLTSGDMIQLPAEYTMREVLEHIAGANGGNFIITPENTLLFVPLYGLDYTEHGNYLADENGNALMFGNEGWYIFV